VSKRKLLSWACECNFILYVDTVTDTNDTPTTISNIYYLETKPKNAITHYCTVFKRSYAWEYTLQKHVRQSHIDHVSGQKSYISNPNVVPDGDDLNHWCQSCNR
jgi:hypothetical protein